MGQVRGTFEVPGTATHLRRDSKAILFLSFRGNCESLACKHEIRSFLGMTNKQVSRLKCVAPGTFLSDSESPLFFQVSAIIRRQSPRRQNRS